MIETIQALDAQILLFIQNFIRCAPLDPIMKFFSVIGNHGICWIALGLILLIPRKTRRGGFDMLLCLALSWAVSELLIKELVARPRPYTTISELQILVAPLTSFSFPSGHANASFASAMALALAFPRKGAWAFVPAALIALSRIYVGVHYPSDIVCGAIIGVVMALIVFKLSHLIFKGKPRKSDE